MTQNEFFNIVMDGLKDFPEIKLQDIISYYENYFTTKLDAGKTEDDIVTELGNPNLIVNKLRNENLNITINSENATNNVITHTDNEVFNINTTTFTENQNTTIDNKSSDIYSDFKTNDNLNNVSIENNFEINSDPNDFKTNNSYDSNDDFYDLYNQNISPSSQESNYKSVVADKSYYNFHSKYGTESSNDNVNNSNSDFHNEQSSHNFDNKSLNDKISKPNVNTILKICIIILALIIFFPVITGIVGCIIGLFGIAIGIFAASIGVLVGGTFTSFIGFPNVPDFVANFPYPVIVLFSLGSISLSILLIILFYYIGKFFILTLIKIHNSLKSKGGAL